VCPFYIIFVLKLVDISSRLVSTFSPRKRNILATIPLICFVVVRVFGVVLKGLF
jgi:hypothetical protein